MPFLTVAGYTLDVQQTGARQQESVRAGSVRPSFSGVLRSDAGDGRRVWEFETAPMAQADMDAVVGAIAAAEFPTVSGDAIGASSITAHVRVTAAGYVADGLSFKRVLTLLVEEAQPFGYTPTPSAPPAAPSGLTGTMALSGAALTWVDNSLTETSVRIERADGLNATTGFVEIASVGADVTTYTDTTGAASTPYSWRVRARNGAGDSAYSNTFSGTTSAPPAGSNPPVTRGLLRDWDAERGVTLVDAAVSAWADQTGAQTLAQDTVTDRPSVLANALNTTRSALVANGHFFDGLIPLGVTDELTIYVVLKPTAIGFHNVYDAEGVAPMLWIDGVGKYQVDAIASTDPNAATNLWSTLAIRSGVGGMTLRRNGAQVQTDATSSAPSGKSLTALNRAGASGFQGHLARWLIYTVAHTAQEITDMEAWLRTEYATW